MRKSAKLAEILSHLAARDGVSLPEISRATGISLQVLYNLRDAKTRRPQAKTLRRLAEFFNVSTEQLLGKSPILDQTASDSLIEIIASRASSDSEIATSIGRGIFSYPEDFQRFPSITREQKIDILVDYLKGKYIKGGILEIPFGDFDRYPAGIKRLTLELLVEFEKHLHLGDLFKKWVEQEQRKREGEMEKKEGEESD